MWFDPPRQARTRESNSNRRASNEISSSSAAEPGSPNIRWFFDKVERLAIIVTFYILPLKTGHSIHEKDADHSGSLTMSELWIRYTENDWYNGRYQGRMGYCGGLNHQNHIKASLMEVYKEGRWMALPSLNQARQASCREDTIMAEPSFYQARQTAMPGGR